MTEPQLPTQDWGDGMGRVHTAKLKDHLARETFADGKATGSFRADERAGQKARTLDGNPLTRVRFLHRLVPEQVGPPDCPIMLRWTVLGSSGRHWRLMLHRFPPLSDDRDPHDHPCDFWTLVLAGGYDDLQPTSAIASWRCRGCGFEADGRHDHERHRCMRPPVGRRRIEITYALAVGDRMRRGSFRHRRAEHTHRSRAGSGGCWTLVLMAPRRREWGFWHAGKWFHWETYERMFGFGMRCD